MKHWNLPHILAEIAVNEVCDFEGLNNVVELKKKIDAEVDDNGFGDMFEDKPELKSLMQDIVLHAAQYESEEGNPDCIDKQYIYGACSVLAIVLSGNKLMKSEA